MINLDTITKSFTYRGHHIPAVSELSLTVPEGEICALVGPNGAGKTTTLRMLTTLMRPTSGTITVHGRDTRRDAARVRGMLGYVPQRGSVSGEERVRDELIFQGALFGMSQARAAQRADELLTSCDLHDMAHRKAQQLSGGQKRRVDIALALMHSPSVLILDEPTVGLDPQSRAELAQQVTALRESLGVTVIMTTHYLDEAESLADRIVVIDHGTVIADATARQLVSRYARDRIVITTNSPGNASLAGGVLSEYSPEIHDSEVRLALSDAASATPHVTALLTHANIPVQRFEVTQGRLDDVFFTLTGRALRD